MMEIEEKTVNADGTVEAFIVKADAGDLCRLCANTDNQLIPIYRGEGLEHHISVKIEKHLPIIKVTEVDKLPLQICYQCASTLISWHNLYEGCLVADKRLREILAIDEKLCPEDESFGDYVDDYRDNYDDDTHETLPTSTNSSNVEANTSKDNSTVIPILSDTKVLNETDLEASDERKMEPYCLTLSDVSENTIDNYILAVDSYDVVVEQNDSKEKPSTQTDTEAVTGIPVNEDESYLCTACGEKFASIEDLAKHNVFLHNVGGISYPCELCDREFKAKNKLSQHIRADHRSSEAKDPIVRLADGKFKCPICFKVFCRKLNANQHFMSHVAEKNLLCDQCRFRCHTQAQLDAHKKKHEKRFCCEICSKMFAYKFQLDIHVQGVHYNLRPFSCQVCGKAFKTRYNFGSHMAQHKDIRNFECPYCDRRCRKSYDLRIHIRTHTGEKPFQCKYCQKSYSQNGDRMKHEKHCAVKAGGSQSTSVEKPEKRGQTKLNAIQVLEVDRYPDNEIIELAGGKEQVQSEVSG